MLDFITAGSNLPFTLAMAMMLVLATLELLGFLFGLSIAGFLDGWFDFDIGEADSSELVTVSLVDKFMGWLHFGKVPVLILLAVFLVSFGILGYLLQGTLWAVSGLLLPWWIAVPVVLPLTLPCVRVFGGTLARILPKDETQSVSQAGLVGRMATVVLGTARPGSPAQAKVRDQHGQTHYVMVEPDQPDDAFHAGETVLLVAQAGAIFRVIRNDNPALSS